MHTLRKKVSVRFFFLPPTIGRSADGTVISRNATNIWPIFAGVKTARWDVSGEVLVYLSSTSILYHISILKDRYTSGFIYPSTGGFGFIPIYPSKQDMFRQMSISFSCVGVPGDFGVSYQGFEFARTILFQNDCTDFSDSQKSFACEAPYEASPK